MPILIETIEEEVENLSAKQDYIESVQITSNQEILIVIISICVLWYFSKFTALILKIGASVILGISFLVLIT